MVNWQLKIKAFLYHLPWEVLCDQPPKDEERRELIRALAGDEDLDVARQAHTLAAALDEYCFLPEQLWAVWKETPCLIHPLVGKELNLKLDTMGQDLSARARQVVQTALQQVKQQYLANIPREEDYKRAFLTLWRLLPDPRWDRLGSLPAELKAIWELLPADPRVPDHSIWDLASAASALASTYEGQDFKPAFLLFTIASAQEFVAAARRTQDLWMGSFLLSYLIWRAMEPIIEKVGPDAIVFPDLRGQPLVDRWLLHSIELKDPLVERRAKDLERLKIANLPNIFTAIVPQERAEKLGKEVVEKLREAKRTIATAAREYAEGAVKQESNLNGLIQEATSKIRDQEYRQKVRDHLMQQLKKLSNDSDWKRIWKHQIDNFLEPQIFWVALPWDALGSNLDDILKRIEELNGRPLPEEFQALYNALKECSRRGDGNKGTHLALAYPLLSSLAGRLLISRKNLRHFQQVKEPGHKCSQCGVREALHLKLVTDRDPYPEVRAFWEVLQRVGEREQEGVKRKLAGRIRRGDRLCAVCLVKRLAWEAFFLQYKPKEGGFSDLKEELTRRGKLPAHLLFPSTASVATAKFRERLLKYLLGENGQDDLWEKLKEFMEKIQRLRGVLYPSAGFPKLEKLAQAIVDNTVDSKKKEVRKVLQGDHQGDNIGFLRLDGDWLFPESFDQRAVEREYGVKLSEEYLKEAREALQDLLNVAKREGIPQPQPYLAVLAMDGDKMGEWVTGRRGPLLKDILHPKVRESLGQSLPQEILEQQRPLGLIHHRMLSVALKNFALELVRPVIEDAHCGRLVYAGGDDVLALLPLTDLPDVMRDLRDLFAGAPREVGLGEGRIVKIDVFPQLISNGEEQRLLLPGFLGEHREEDRAQEQKRKKMSISAGVAIVHMTHPFWHAVEEAHRALKIAKAEADVDKGQGRDAWVVQLLKRSGEPRLSGGKWQYNDLDVLQGIARVVDLFEKGLSPRFIYQMQEISSGMEGEDLPSEARQAEMERLLSRREGLDEEGKKLLDSLNIPGWFDDLGETGSWERVLEWLRLARFLAQGAREV